MQCKLCLNQDLKYFYKGKNGYYCRKCIGFKKVLLDEELEALNSKYQADTTLEMSYTLTKNQQEISLKCLYWLLRKKDVFLNCVCGAGKTEITLKAIKYFLEKNQKVCFSISRKEVVKELALRLQELFPKLKITAVYGGHHEVIDGELIICTTHQLYRYWQSFDLLIIDEVDGFPLAGNQTLMNIAMNSCKGNIIFSSATSNEFIEQNLSKRDYIELKLYNRPSNKPLIYPRVYYLLSIFKYLLCFFLLLKNKNQVIVFVEQKKECVYLYKLFKPFLSVIMAYSDYVDKDKNIKAFKEKKYQFIISTTILERGITIKDVDVLIINANKKVFNKASYIQMLGRVGRSYTNPYGNAYIITDYLNKDIKQALKEIKNANRKLTLSLLRCTN